MNNLQKLNLGNFSIFILLIILSSLVCFAQDTIDVKNTNTKSTETKINLIVTDKDYNFVNNLTKEDISIFIDGKEQMEFTLEKETLPLLYMLSADNSGSLRLLWGDIKKSIEQIIRQNNSDDLIALMRFVSSDIIQTTDKFSSDEKYLFSNLDLFQIEGGQTALIDAIYNSVKVVANQKGVKDNYRRVVVVISDGDDRNSKNTKKQLSELLIENNVQVFFIGLIQELDEIRKFRRKSSEKKAKEFIRNIAEKSGGVAVFIEDVKYLPKIASQIVDQMRTQLVVKIPAIENLDSKKVEIKPSKIAKKRRLQFNYRAGLIK